MSNKYQTKELEKYVQVMLVQGQILRRNCSSLKVPIQGSIFQLSIEISRLSFYFFSKKGVDFWVIWIFEKILSNIAFLFTIIKIPVIIQQGYLFL